VRGQGLLLAAVSAVVVAAVGIGFLVLGTPGEARKGELDKKRLEDLENLETVVTSDWAPGRFGTLPPSLDDVRTMKSGRRDPVTGKPYGARSSTRRTSNSARRSTPG
jgi:hypothetical protein